MPIIYSQEKLRRRRMVDSVLGTHAMEGIEPDAETLVLFEKYVSGEFTMDEFSAAMDAHAYSLVNANRLFAGVA